MTGEPLPVKPEGRVTLTILEAIGPELDDGGATFREIESVPAVVLSEQALLDRLKDLMRHGFVDIGFRGWVLTDEGRRVLP